MNTKDEFQPAFPIGRDVTQGECATDCGISLRDYFAAHFDFSLEDAAKRLLSIRAGMTYSSITVEQAIDEVVRVKRLYADAMLKARAQ